MLLLLQISMNAKMTTAAAVMNVLMTMADTTARVLSHFNSLTIIETVEVRRRARFGFRALVSPLWLPFLLGFSF